MGRKRRPNLTGVPFHLTARIQGRDALFAGLESRVIEWIRYYAARSRMQLLAWAIMPNHLHIVAVQGDLPLWLFMQPLLRRVALDVKARTGRQGHVFERRYDAVPVLTAEHLRNAIIYVHLNPVRARICDSPEGAINTSHGLYYRHFDESVPSPLAGAIELVLRIFSTSAGDSLESCRCRYVELLRWRVAADRLTLENGDAPSFCAAIPPDNSAGDIEWDRQYGRIADCFAAAVALQRRIPSLETIALGVIDDECSGAPLEWLRSGERMRRLARARRIMIARSIAAGYANHQIANYLNISNTTISKVRSSQPLPLAHR